MLGGELSWVWTINQNLSVESLQLTNPLKKSYKSEWMSLENTFYPIFSKLVRPFYPPRLIDIPLNRTFTTYSVHLLSRDLGSSKAIYRGVPQITSFLFLKISSPFLDIWCPRWGQKKFLRRYRPTNDFKNRKNFRVFLILIIQENKRENNYAQENRGENN